MPAAFIGGYYLFSANDTNTEENLKTQIDDGVVEEPKIAEEKPKVTKKNLRKHRCKIVRLRSSR